MVLTIGCCVLAASGPAKLGPAKVREFGAKCDGATDDTAAIQRAIDAGLLSGQTVLLPLGTCVISPVTPEYALKIGSNLQLEGAGAGSILKLKDGAGDFTTLFGPLWVKSDNIAFRNFTVDYNSSQNEPSSLSRPRFLIGTGGGSNGMTWDQVTVRNIAAVNVIYSGSRNTRISKCRFELDMSSRLYHDHSTLYVASEDGQIVDNIFVGGINLPGSATAIETHGGHQDVSGNVITGYFAGMNLTGIAATTSEGISVSANNIVDGYHGITLWSRSYRAHTTGTGLSNTVITRNSMRLEQTRWTTDPVSGKKVLGNPNGITVEPNSNLPLDGLLISNNTVEFDKEVSDDTPVSGSSGMGIGYWDATGSNKTLNVKIMANTVLNAPTCGIRWAASGDTVEMSGNKLVNPGSAANPMLIAAYRAAVMISPKNPISHVLISQNEILSSSEPGMSYGIEVVGDSCVIADGNTASSTGGPKSGYLKYIHAGKTSCPAVVHGVQLAPSLKASMLPANGVSAGSVVSDGSGRSWRYNGIGWIEDRQ